MNNFTTAVTNRRTNYALSKDVSISQETIIKTIEDMVREVPSAFNMQSGKVVVAFGETHDKIWQIAMDTLRGIVPAANFAATEEKSIPLPPRTARSSILTISPSLKNWPTNFRCMHRTSPSGASRLTA